MQVIRSSTDTQKGPADRFGAVRRGAVPVVWGEHVTDGRYDGGRTA